MTIANILSKNSKDSPEAAPVVRDIHSSAHRHPSYRSDIGSDSDNFDSSSNSLNQVQEFGDVLRESLSTRQKEQQQEERRRWVTSALPGTGRFLKSRNRRRPDSEHEPILAIQEEEKTEEKIDCMDNITKSNSISTVIEAFEEPDAAISGDDNDSKERPCCIGHLFRVLSGCLLSIFSCLITRIDEVTGEEKDDEEQGCSAERNTNSSRSSTSSWELNWKRIGYCLSVVVFLEVLLVVGLLIAFLMHDGG